MQDLREKLKRVQDQIAAATARSGREPEEVTLIAVSKTRAAAEISAASLAGVTEFGENYVQELVAKQGELRALEACHWHFIGHLQRNKVRSIVSLCTLIHVVDSIRLAEEISRRAGEIGRVQPVLLQVDLAGEESKYGCPLADVTSVADTLASLPHLQWQGLMTIPPVAHDPEGSRPYYRRLRELGERLRGEGVAGEHLWHLSMGMSNDFEVAIEEGATLVRVGTAIFGPRH